MDETCRLLIARANAAQRLCNRRAQDFMSEQQMGPETFDTAMLVYDDVVFRDDEAGYLSTYVQEWGLEETLAFSLIYARVSPELLLAFNQSELSLIPGVGEEEFADLVEARETHGVITDDDGE